jgi:hypothetical protein
MIRRWQLYVLCSLVIPGIVAVSVSCASRAGLTVTPEHQSYLTGIDDDYYGNSSIHKLFTRLQADGDKICQMIYETAPYDEAVAKRFSAELDFRKKPKQKWYDNVRASLIAGCFNFYKMNDRGVHNVFKIIEGMYPVSKDCFTVGFSQFYIMRQEMNCARAVAIDADWRILKAHYDFQEKVRSKRPEDTALSILKSLEIGWVAHFDMMPVPRETVQNEINFCMQTERSHCLRSFEHFVAQPEIARTELLLGFIHDARIAPKNNDISIVFTSNALDGDYTSQEQFEKLTTGIRDYLPRGKRIAMVYQAGDSEDIAVYELEKTEEDTMRITIRCRDNLRWSDRYVKAMRGKSFDTWFDKMLQRRTLTGIPRCHVGGTRVYITSK